MPRFGDDRPRPVFAAAVTARRQSACRPMFCLLPRQVSCWSSHRALQEGLSRQFPFTRYGDTPQAKSPAGRPPGALDVADERHCINAQLGRCGISP